jgi:hypothetical protein
MRFFIAVLLLSGVCSAQTEPGSLTAIVTDVNGARITKTSATLRLERAQNNQYSTETDEKGEFRFDSLPAGVP